MIYFYSYFNLVCCFVAIFTLIIQTVSLHEISLQEDYNVTKSKVVRPQFIPHVGSKRHRCGGLKHSEYTRPCLHNDTLCGHWKGRHWHALGCHYHHVTPEEARKCLGNRTLAFIGDSQIRDIAVGVVMLLLGQSLDEAPSEKFDYKQSMDSNGTRIPDFASWKNNVPGHNHNGHIFPQPDVAKQNGYEWQVQVWSLFNRGYIHEGQVDSVLFNEKMKEFPLLRKIDFAFWSHGLHDYGWWDSEPYGEKYYEQMVGEWKRLRLKIPMPSVWVSMNPECRHLITFALSSRMDIQAQMVEEANWYTNKRTMDEKIPYWDAAAVLRSPDRCNVSDDGVHVKMFVDVMRAKMLFNHLCDSDMNWRGSIDHFI